MQKLAPIAAKVLAQPCCVSASERVWTKYEKLQDVGRLSLHHSNLVKQLFVHHNNTVIDKAHDFTHDPQMKAVSTEDESTEESNELEEQLEDLQCIPENAIEWQGAPDYGETEQHLFSERDPSDASDVAADRREPSDNDDVSDSNVSDLDEELNAVYNISASAARRRQ